MPRREGQREREEGGANEEMGTRSGLEQGLERATLVNKIAQTWVHWTFLSASLLNFSASSLPVGGETLFFACFLLPTTNAFSESARIPLFDALQVHSENALQTQSLKVLASPFLPVPATFSPLLPFPAIFSHPINPDDPGSTK